MGGRSTSLFCAALATAAVLLAVPGLPDAYTLYPVRPLFTIEQGFLQPSDVAVGRDNQIYVVDGVNNCVKVFDERGAFKFLFGSRGHDRGQFKSPLGITIDRAGQVYIADAGNHRVQVFSPAGDPRAVIAIPAGSDEHPADPVDVALDETRQQLYIVDNDNHHVLVYSLPDYKPLAVWGKEGEMRDNFNFPFFIAVGKDTSVFIVDVINTRVQVWSPQGKAVATIGSWGVDLGQVYRPKGVCVDRNNQVYVSDSYVGALQVFNRYGHFKGVVGAESGEVLKLKTPVGITIDDRQRLYVVEMAENRVGVYELLETIIQK